jgi:uncharacterized protein
MELGPPMVCSVKTLVSRIKTSHFLALYFVYALLYLVLALADARASEDFDEVDESAEAEESVDIPEGGIWGNPPSFDCMKASLQDEITICLSIVLSVNDRYLAVGHSLAVRKLGKRKADKLARFILSTRRACGYDVECIAREQAAGFRVYQAEGVKALEPKTSERERKSSSKNEFPLASCKSWNGTITFITGQDTSNAQMEGAVRQDDLLEYCLRQSIGQTAPLRGSNSIEQCVNDLKKDEEGTKLAARADCLQRKISNRRGQDHSEEYLFVPIAGEVNWLTQDVSIPFPTACAGDMFPVEQQFRLLCPSVWREEGLK